MARESARVIPVILEDCEWRDQPFRKAESGNVEEGLPILREAEALFETLGIGKYLAVTKANLAIAYERMGDLESAAKELRAALDSQGLQWPARRSFSYMTRPPEG